MTMMRSKLSMPLVIGVLLVLVGLFLRLYNRDQAMYYMDDQGDLLLTAHKIIYSHHTPLAGPIITFEGGSIHPLLYYFVAALEVVSADPRGISSEYIILSVLSGLLVGYYAFLRFDVWTGIWTLFFVMTSASMIEHGRSIWNPFPTMIAVCAYLAVTEVAFRKKNLWVYCFGVLLYVFAIAFYPTPALLALFVLMRSFSHLRSFGGLARRYGALLSFLLLGGMFTAVFGPWVMQSVSLQQTNTLSIIRQATHLATWYQATTLAFVFATTVVQDVVRIWTVTPGGEAGRVLRVLIGAIVVVTSIMGSQKTFVSSFKGFFRSGYHWAFLGFVLPALFGMQMPAYRFLPLYPIIFVLCARWVHLWIIQHNNPRRGIIFFALFIFVVGNAASWWTTTITHPRREYEAAQVLMSTIQKDMVYRKTQTRDIGVHLFRPEDQYDFFAEPLYYLLHVSINYPVKFVLLGNEPDRRVRENHPLVYLVCDKFDEAKVLSECVGPYQLRWKNYVIREVRALSKTTNVVVFEKTPGV